MKSELDRQITKLRNRIARHETLAYTTQRELDELLRQKYQDCRCCEYARKDRYEGTRFGIPIFSCFCYCHNLKKRVY